MDIRTYVVDWPAATTTAMSLSSSSPCRGTAKNAEQQSLRSVLSNYGAADSNNSSSSSNNNIAHIADVESAQAITRAGNDENEENLQLLDDSSSASSLVSHSQQHSIGYVGSFAIAINSLAGPAVLQLPFQYQQSGFVATTAALLGIALLSTACSLYICRVVHAIPTPMPTLSPPTKKKDSDATTTTPNSSMPVVDMDDQPIELTTAVWYFWNHRAYMVTQWLFFACTFCLNVAAMIDTAQVVDTFIGVSGAMCTVGWSPSLDQNHHSIVTWSHPRCTRRQVKLGHCEPFVYHHHNAGGGGGGGGGADMEDPLDPSGPILTLGYLITAAVFVPLCLMDLKENTHWQIGGCALLITLSIYFCFAFFQMDDSFIFGGSGNSNSSLSGDYDVMAVNHSTKYHNSTQRHHKHHTHNPDNLRWWGREYRDLLGVILFNYALVLALPAWMHSKKQHVKVSTVVYGSTAISTLLYIGVGTIVALSIPHANVNMLAPMVSGAFGTGIQVASSIFCFFIIGLDIPLFCVLTRYNLSQLLPNRPRLVNALVVYIPWATSWLLYQGDAIGTLLDWGGVLLTSAIAFLLPLYLAYRVLTRTSFKLQLEEEEEKDDNRSYSRQNQLRWIVLWLVLTCAAVVVAIGGQAAAQHDRDDYLASDVYVNETSNSL